jgi:hypothetical protein
MIGIGELAEGRALDEACDAIVLQFPFGSHFTIRRVVNAETEQLVLHATKSTTRTLYQAP